MARILECLGCGVLIVLFIIVAALPSLYQDKIQIDSVIQSKENNISAANGTISLELSYSVGVYGEHTRVTQSSAYVNETGAPNTTGTGVLLSAPIKSLVDAWKTISDIGIPRGYFNRECSSYRIVNLVDVTKHAVDIFQPGTLSQNNTYFNSFLAAVSATIITSPNTSTVSEPTSQCKSLCYAEQTFISFIFVLLGTFAVIEGMLWCTTATSEANWSSSRIIIIAAIFCTSIILCSLTDVSRNKCSPYEPLESFDTLFQTTLLTALNTTCPTNPATCFEIGFDAKPGLDIITTMTTKCTGEESCLYINTRYEAERGASMYILWAATVVSFLVMLVPMLLRVGVISNKKGMYNLLANILELSDS